MRRLNMLRPFQYFQRALLNHRKIFLSHSGGIALIETAQEDPRYVHRVLKRIKTQGTLLCELTHCQIDMTAR